MMAKLGFKQGDALGKRASPADNSSHDNGGDDGAGAGASNTSDRFRTEPLNLIFKEDRGGIGLDSERKRKIREEAEEAVKKIKHEEGDYRDRVRMERETRRTEAQVRAAQSVAERLDAEAEEEVEDEGEDEDGDAAAQGRAAAEDREPSTESSGTPTSRPEVKKKKKKKKNAKPTSQINVLYRGLVREREERERSLHAQRTLQSSLPSSFFPTPRLPGYDDPTLEREDNEALGSRQEPSTILEQELEEEDPDLDAFNTLDPKEQLTKLVMYLREKHQYCFWCKYRYETGEMEGCPGITEEDHD